MPIIPDTQVGESQVPDSLDNVMRLLSKKKKEEEETGWL